MSIATVSIDRSSLPGTLSPLLVTDDDATYRLTLDGLGEPGYTWRERLMPDSADVHGSELVAAVLERTSLPLEVIVMASSSAALKTAMTALRDAVWQFSYPVTVTVDGQSETWAGCGPAAWALSNSKVDHSHVAQFFRVVTIVIPLYNPIAS